MINNTDINPTLTLKNMGGTYTVEVDQLNIAIILATSRGLLKAENFDKLRKLATDACGYREGEEPFRAWTSLEVLIAWVDSGNFI